MKRLLSVAALSLFVVAPAIAADLPARVVQRAPAPVVIPVYTWTGCYIGGNAGGHFGRDKISTTTTVGNFAAGQAAAYDAQSPVKLSPAGFIGGGQLGCNYQSGGFVVGIEGDGQWMTGKEDRRLVFAPPVTAGNFMTNEIRNSWLATVRGRAGFTTDRVLFYVTGGAAFGGLKTTDALATFGGTVVSTVSDTHSRFGWTVGGGIEYAFGFNWTARVEYLYVDLGKFDVSIPCVAACVGATDTVVHHRYTDHIVRAALNYKFGGPVVARY